MSMQKDLSFTVSPYLRISAPLSSSSSRGSLVAVLMFFTICLVTTGCGYHFPGGGAAPGDINSIAVDVLDNRTAEVGIEATFTNAILTEFIRWKRLEVKPRREAEGILGGAVARISTLAVAHRGPEQTLETRVTITLALTLKRAETNEVLWENANLSYFDDYVETGDALATARLRREAICEIAEFLAEKIHNDLFEGF